MTKNFWMMTCLLASLTGMNLSFASDASASEVSKKTGKAPRGKTTLYTDRSYGFSILMPADFHLTSEQGDLLFFQSHERAGTMIIRPRPGLALNTIQATLRNGFDNEQVVLTMSGAPSTLELNGGMGLARDAAGTVDGRDVKGILAGVFGSGGQGYMVLIGSVRERWPGFKFYAQDILNSLTIMPKEIGFEYERWRYRLQNRRLIYLEGYGGRVVGGDYMAEYHFCKNGDYYQRTDSVDSRSNGWAGYSSGSTSKHHGQWRVVLEQGVPNLILSASGRRSVIRLEQSGPNLLFNGRPYQFAANELCH